MTTPIRGDDALRDAQGSLYAISTTVVLSSITHAQEFASAVPLAVGALLAAILFVLHTHHRRRGARWAFVLYGLLNLVIIGGPGVYNGLWSHGVKVVVRAHHGGILPPPLRPFIVSPDLGMVYETLCVLTFVASMFAAWFGFRYARSVMRASRADPSGAGGWTALIVVLLASHSAPTAAQEPMALTLGDAARYAAAHSAAAEAARLRVSGAQARLRERRAELLPALMGGLSLGASTINSASFGLAPIDPVTGTPWFDPEGEVLGPTRVWDARVEIRQALVDLAAHGRVGAARAAVAAAHAEADNVSDVAAAAAATLYVRALRADAHLSVLHADSALAQDLLDIALGRRKAGMAIDLDVTRARAQVAATTAQLIEARTERERARQRLRQALGMTAAASLVLTDSLLRMPTDLPVQGEGEAVEEALGARSALRAVEAGADVAARRLGALRKERLPSLSAFADLGSTGPRAAGTRRTYAWGLRVSIPLFDGLGREGRIAGQRSVVRELEVLRGDLERQVALEVRLARLELASAAQKLAASDQRLVLAEEEQELARRRFLEGVAGNADVITALLALNAARTELVDAHATFQAARVALAASQASVTRLP